MKKPSSILSLFAAAVLCAAAPDADWQPPSHEHLPEAKVSVPSPTAARWIWFRDRNAGGGTCYYRYVFDLDDTPVAADVNCIMEHQGNFYINGVEVKGHWFPMAPRPLSPLKYDILPHLKKGRNIIAAKITADSRYSGDMMLRGLIRLQSGKEVRIFTSKAFKVITKASGNWQALDYDDSSWQAAVEQGNAHSRDWCLRGDILSHFGFPEEIAEFDAIMAKISSAEIPESIGREPFPQVSIKYSGDMAGICINGEMHPPFIRLGLSQLPDGESARDSIIKTAHSGGRIFEISYPAGASPIGKLEDRMIDAISRVTLSFAPDGYLIYGLHFVREEEWTQKHPEEAVTYYRPPKPEEIDYRGFTPNRPSPASRKFRDAYIAQIKDLCRQIKAAPWGRRVIGLRISYGYSSEWIQYGSYSGMPDHSKPMLAEFRKFLKKKYGTDAALQKAWNAPAVTLETAKVPGYKERWGREYFLREPSTADQQTLDFYIATQEVMSDCLLELAKAAKEELPNILVGAWNCYDFCGYAPEGQHVWGDKLLDSGLIDFLSMPYGYEIGDRKAGDPGFHEQILSRFRRTGKLSILEADIRSPFEVKRGTAEPHLGMKDETEYSAVIRRDFANMYFFNGQGIQFNTWHNPKDMRDSFDYVCVHRAVHDSRKLWEEIWKNPPRMQGFHDTAVVFDSKQFVYNGYPEWSKNRDLVLSFGIKTMNALLLSGHQFDLLTIEDYLGTAKDYRRVVFLNQFYLSDRQRKTLATKIGGKDVNTIWIYAPGFITEQGFRDGAMLETTGISLRADRSGKKLPLKMRLNDDRVYEVPGRSEHLRVFSDDVNAEVLARYTDNGAPAMVRKRLPKGNTAIFCGIPINDPVLWDSLLRTIGSHGWIEAGTPLRANDRFILVSTGGAGTYIVSPPNPAKKYVDLYNGREFVPVKGRLYLKSAGAETWFLKAVD